MTSHKKDKALSDILRHAMGLGLFALVTVGAISVTETLTKERIQQAQQNFLNQTLLKVIRPAQSDLPGAEISLTPMQIPDAADTTQVYAAKQRSQVIAMVVPGSAPDGYSGEIELLAGINADGELLGVRVLAHQETPGLGDAIELEKSNWILVFDGKSLANTAPEGWSLKQSGGTFDSLTGATITAQAVVRQVHRTLLWHQEHTAGIFASGASQALPSACDAQGAACR